MGGRDLPSRFGAMGISSSPRHHEEGRRYNQHHRMAPQPQSQPPPVQTPPQHQQQAVPPQPLPPLPTSGGAGPRPLPPLVAPLGGNDRPMFPDARQNEIPVSGGGGGMSSSTSGTPTTRRRPLPPPLSQPYAYQQEQQYHPQHYQRSQLQSQSQSQTPLPSPRGGYPAESYHGPLTSYDGDDGNGKSQFALSRPTSHPCGSEESERRMVPATNNVASPPDDSYRHPHYSDVPETRPQPHLHRSHPSPRSAHYEDDAYAYRQDHHHHQHHDGDEYYYESKFNSQNYSSWQPHGRQDQQYRPAPSPRSRRRSSLEDFRDDDNNRFQMERRKGPVPSSPARRGGLASPRRRRQPPMDTYDGYFGHDDDVDDDDDDYRRRIVYSPSVESDISTKSATSRRQIRPNRSRHAAPAPSPRNFCDDDMYEVDRAPSRRDRLLRSPAIEPSRTSRNASVYDNGPRRLQDPFIVEEEEDLYDVEIYYPSILRQSPRQLHADLGRRVTFSPSTELPDEDSYASQRSICSRSTASASVAHGVITSSMPGGRTSSLETRRMQEESEARQQVVAEIRQAMEMRDSARDVRDVEFWERQIITLNRALRKLGSSPRTFTGSSSHAYSGGRDLLTSSSLQNEETSSRTSSISGRSSGTARGIRRGEVFSVHPQEDEFHLAETSALIPTKNIKVRAPSNLNEGHQLTLRRGGETIVATVPRGGVRAGEVFTVCVSR